MRSTLVPIVSLLLSTFLMMVGAGLSGVVLPVRGALEGWSIYEIGLLGTGYAVAFTLGCFVAPGIVRRAGHVRAFTALVAFLAICALLHGLIVHPLVWILIRGASGFALAGAFMIIESWLNERVTNESRGLVFSLYMVATMGAVMTGQFVMPFTDPLLTTPFMLCGIAFAAAVIPTAMSRQAHPKPLTEVRLDLRAIFATSPAAAVGVIMGGVMEGAWNNMAPVFGNAVGYDRARISTLLVATMAGGILLQFPLGRLSDRIDRRLVMSAAGFLCAALALTAAMMASRDPATIFLTAFLMGGLVYPVYSLAVAHANDMVESSDFVKTAGGLLILYGIGTMFGPMLAAGLMQTRGPHGLFLAIAGCSFVMAVFSLFRMSRRQGPPPAPESFATMPLARAQTPGSLVLDPRAEASPEAAPEAGDAPPQG